MAIYDIFSHNIDSAYSIEGNELDQAFDINGTKIFSKSQDYSQYSIIPVFNKSRQSAQGMDIYGNYMAIWRDDTYSLQIVNINNWTIEYTIPTDVVSHGNDISFSSIFYDESNTLPLLFVGRVGLRLNLTNQTSERIYTIIATPSGDTWVAYGTAFNDDMTRYYTMGYNTDNYNDSSGFIFLETWDISENLENPTRLSIHTRAWFPCIQGVAYHDGLLWVASGLNNPVKVYAIDPSNAEIAYTIDLTRTGELEGIGWGQDPTTGKYFCVYGQIYNGITYYRIDFEQ